MITTTWELHLAAPGSPEEREALLSDLDLKRQMFTQMRMDYLEDGDTISVMFADTDVLGALLATAAQYCRVEKLTCQFSEVTYDGTCHGTLVLDNEEAELSEISFPTAARSE